MFLCELHFLDLKTLQFMFVCVLCGTLDRCKWRQTAQRFLIN